MSVLDLVIIAGYLTGILLLGAWSSRRQHTTRDFFLANREVPWWAIAASIVATETSTITFISVPGIAYARGGDFGFLQLVFGYLLGRVLISVLFIPSYFKGELLTVYELLNRRFGGTVKMLAASLFVLMRNLADGVRLLLTALVLAAVLHAFLPGFGIGAAIVASVLLLALAMMIFTYYGGMEAVIWIEVVQLGIYLGGAVAAAAVLLHEIPGGWATIVSAGSEYGKFRIFDLAFDLTKTYTFWGGLIGGCFLNMSTHGTDQYLVQRYLCTTSPRLASRALLVSGVLVLIQFVGFLMIGVLLFAFYQPFKLPGYTFAGAPAALPFDRPDQVFPAFITTHLPSGISGLVVAAIFAAALSSSLNSISATTLNDLYKPFVRERDEAHYLKISRWLTLLFGVVQSTVALLFYMEGNDSALNAALAIASLFNGPVLGVFLLGSWSRRAGQRQALVGIAASSLLMLYVWLGTPIAWPWYTVIGSLSCVAAGHLAGLVGSRSRTAV